MVWYHVSTSSDLEVVVMQGHPRTAADPARTATLRVPLESFGETQALRFCIAPSVWQCLVSVGGEGARTIYTVVLRGAPVRADATVRDNDLTDEHWITEDVLAGEGGEILLLRLGVVYLDGKNCLDLKVEAQSRRAKGRAPPEDREIFDVDGSQWKFKR